MIEDGLNGVRMRSVYAILIVITLAVVSGAYRPPCSAVKATRRS